MERYKSQYIKTNRINTWRYKNNYKFRWSSTESIKRHIPCSVNSFFFFYQIFIKRYSELEKLVPL